jgi:preprotein translocase subunit SecF
MPIENLLDLSINTTLSRTIMTSMTTSLALLALVLFGGSVIKSFSWAMIFGVVIGTYSSIFIAAPVLIYLGARSVTMAEDKAQAPADAAPAKR